MLESLAVWLKVHHGFSYAEQAAQSGLNECTLRRWALGAVRPRPTATRDYLAWAVNGALAPLDSTTCDISASMPAGWRAYWACSPASYVVLVVWRGRLVRFESGLWPAQQSLDGLRPQLVERVLSWGREALGTQNRD